MDGYIEFEGNVMYYHSGGNPIRILQNTLLNRVDFLWNIGVF